MDALTDLSGPIAQPASHSEKVCSMMHESSQVQDGRVRNE